MTKQIEQFMGQEKEYVGTISLGATTPSYDLETEINQYFPTEHIDKELLENTLSKFTGTIDQKPPVFSALKKGGKRLYEFAREGLNIDVPSRKVVIRNFEITQIKFPEIDFKVNCSKGTYIRSLVYDYGKSINSGAYLSALRRTKIGEFSVENAIQMEDFENLLEK
jgi:tRNA pseudouridine55 synthase